MNENEVTVIGQKMTIEFYEEYNAANDSYSEHAYEYENIKGHQVGQHWVAVFTEDNKTFVIPSSRIKRIIVSQE